MRVAKPDNPAPLRHDENVVWLENGKLVEAKKADGWVHDDSGAGWKHISNNRLHDQGDINQFLKFGSVYSNSNQVKELLVDAVRNGRLYLDDAGDSTSIWYIYRVPETDKKVSILVGDNGYIVNALPTDVSK